MKTLILLLIISPAIWAGTVTIDTDRERLDYNDCGLIWNSIQVSSSGNATSYIATECAGAPIGGQGIHEGGQTTLYVNARAYTCTRVAFASATTQGGQLAAYMDCRTDIIFTGGLD